MREQLKKQYIQFAGADSAEFNQWKHEFAVKRVQITAIIGIFVLIVITLAEAFLSVDTSESLRVNLGFGTLFAPLFWIVYRFASRRPVLLFSSLLWLGSVSLFMVHFRLHNAPTLSPTTLPASGLSFILFAGALLLPIEWRTHLFIHLAIFTTFATALEWFQLPIIPDERPKWLWLMTTSIISVFSVLIQERGYRTQQQLVNQLKSAESQYRDIFDNANEGIYRTRPGGRFITANHAMGRILGYESAEALLTDNPDIDAMFVEPGGRSAVPNYWETTEQNLRVFSFPLRRPDGKLIHVKINSRVAVDDNGERFFEGFMQDVTEEHAAQQALASRERILAAVAFAAEQFLGSPSWDGVVEDVLRRLGEAATADQAFIFQFVEEADEIYASLYAAWRAPNILHVINLARLQHVPLGQIGIADWIEQYSEGKPLYGPISMLAEKPRGVFQAMQVETLATVPVFVADRLWGNIGFITQENPRVENPRVWHEAEIDALQAAASNLGAAIQREQIMQDFLRVQKQESIGVLVGGIAHDFNNLLTGMLTQSSLAIRRLPANVPAVKHIEKAVISAERAADLTRQLLAYAGKGRFQLDTIDLNHIVRENLSLLELAIPINIEVNLQLAKHPLIIEVDRGQLQQLIMNLVMNAGEAMESQSSGTLTIRTASTRISDPSSNVTYLGNNTLPAGDYAYLEVSDTGIGMDDKTLASIFDPYFTTKPQGQGLGLSATIGIIRSHKGGMQVKSTPQQGSQFQIWLPTTMNQLSTDTIPGDLHTEQEAVVMVVDDQQLVRDAVMDILELEDIEVLAADGGQEAVDLYREQGSHISVIVLDMQMPGMNGCETYYALQAIDPEVNVLISSGYSEKELSKQFKPGEIAGFLQKPYNFDLLINTVRSFLPKD